MAERFSQQLEDWLKSKQPKTVGNLGQLAGDKGFALIFLVLMGVPALPLPTGGVTHVFEVITILLAAELAIGRQTLWLPKKWLDRPLGNAMTTKALPRLISVIRWVERYSRPRMSHWLGQKSFRQITGLLVLAFATASLLAPPFSGLDTLPALGVVTLSLGIILDDIALFPIGVVFGVGGIILDFTLGRLLIDLVKRY